MWRLTYYRKHVPWLLREYWWSLQSWWRVKRGKCPCVDCKRQRQEKALRIRIRKASETASKVAKGE